MGAVVERAGESKGEVNPQSSTVGVVMMVIELEARGSEGLQVKRAGLAKAKVKSILNPRLWAWL